MTNTSVIDFEVGLRVAVRSGYRSDYGVFVAVGAAHADVRTGDVVRRFSRQSLRMHGWAGTKYDCPYLSTVAEARAKDREYAEAQARAAERLRALGVLS